MAHPGSVLCGCTAAPWARGGAVLCSPCCHPGKAARVLGLKAGVSRAGFGEPWGALEGAASGRWCWWWMRGGSWALASPMAGLTITLEALPDTAPTRAAQLVPQQEPGWGRVRPFGSGAGCWERNVPGVARASAPGREGKGRARARTRGSTRSFTCEGRLRIRPWGVWGPVGAVCGAPASHPGAGAPSFPASPARASPGGRLRPRSRPLRGGGSSFSGLCSRCLWGFSLLLVLRRLSSLPGERVIPHARSRRASGPCLSCKGGFQTAGPPPPRGLGRGLGNPAFVGDLLL